MLEITKSKTVKTNGVSRLVLVLVLFFVGCQFERATEVSFEDGERPVFHLSGSGKLTKLVIFGPGDSKSQTPDDLQYAVWYIRPLDKDVKAKRIGEIGSVQFGVVPSGYEQVLPKGVPLPLEENVIYRFSVETMNAPGAYGYFAVRNGKAFRVTNVPKSCFQLKGNIEERVPCP